MKKLILATIAVCSLFTLSCRKDNQNAVNDLFIGAIKNGGNWVAKPSTGFITPDSLQVLGFRTTSEGGVTFSEETLYFNMRFSGKGLYQLKNGQARYYTTVGLDAITSEYKLDTTQTNKVIISNFNVYTNIANGSFELNFLKISGGSGSPDKLSFSNGKFYVYVPDK